MTMTELAEIRQEAADVIARAATHEITLTPADFRVIDGWLLIDGMPAGEWLDAMVAE